jgi:hypothetical protein
MKNSWNHLRPVSKTIIFDPILTVSSTFRKKYFREQLHQSDQLFFSIELRRVWRYQIPYIEEGSNTTSAHIPKKLYMWEERLINLEPKENDQEYLPSSVHKWQNIFQARWISSKKTFLKVKTRRFFKHLLIVK